MRRPENLRGVPGEARLAAKELPLRGNTEANWRLAGKGGKRRRNRVEGCEHPSLQPAERGDAEAHQLALERAQIVAAKHQVVGEIERARGEGVALDARPPAAVKHPALGRHLVPEGRDLGKKLPRPGRHVARCCHEE